MSELHKWRADHANVLEALGLLTVTTSESRSAIRKKVPGCESIPKNGGAATCGDINTASPMDTSNDCLESDQSSNQKKAGTGDVSGQCGGNIDTSNKKITLQSLSACIHAAETITIGRSLKEVREMRTVQRAVHEWTEQCQNLCPRRKSKRRVQSSNKPTFERLQKLVADGLACPVSVAEEVERIRRHMAEALSWQLNARTLLEEVTTALAEQTTERMEIWRREQKAGKKCGGDLVPQGGVSSVAPNNGGAQSKGEASSPTSSSSDLAKNMVQDSSSVKPAHQSDKRLDSGSTEVDDKSDDDGMDAIDREDELDELEHYNAKSLQHLLTTARDISVFIPEEVVIERVQKIMEWARYSL